MMELTIEQLTHLYNIGYNAGHNDTVEGCDMPAHQCDIEEHQRDVVEEVIDEL